MTKKRNQTFQYLEAIGILMVLDDHVSTRIDILSNIFPYNSFYMPMFVFVSGYFFRQESIFQNFKHKAKHLLLTYLIWACIGEIIAYILMRLGLVNWYVAPFNGMNLLRLFTFDSLSSITGALWFVIMLFWVSVGYNLLSKVFELGRKVPDYFFLVVSVILGFITLKFCMAGYSNNFMNAAIYRTAWYLQFYHMGRMFHLYWEKYIQNFRLLYSCSICVAVNVIIICFIQDKINFFSTAGMAFFNSWWLPLITSITGTLFWYKVMQFLSSKISKCVGGVRIINLIAENTFTIMACHLIFLNIPNFYAYYQFLHGNELYSNFPVNDFVSGAWVRYSGNTRLIGFFIGVLGSLFVIYIINIIKKYVFSKNTAY